MICIWNLNLWTMPKMAAAVGCSQLPPWVLTKCCQTNPLTMPSLSSSKRSWNSQFTVIITKKKRDRPEVGEPSGSPDQKCSQTEWSDPPFQWSKDDQTTLDLTELLSCLGEVQDGRTHQHHHTAIICKQSPNPIQVSQSQQLTHKHPNLQLLEGLLVGV